MYVYTYMYLFMLVCYGYLVGISNIAIASIVHVFVLITVFITIMISIIISSFMRSIISTSYISTVSCIHICNCNLNDIGMNDRIMIKAPP